VLSSFILTLIFGIVLQGGGGLEITGKEGSTRSEAIQTLHHSKDPRERMIVALALARSFDETNHVILRSALLSGEFLEKLDSDEEYLNSAARRLRVARVLDALSKNDSPHARVTLTKLTENEMFLEEPVRTVYLIESTARLKPPPPAVIDFWKTQSDPDEGLPALVVSALVENGTPDALKLLEMIMADPRQDKEDKTIWIRSDILEHRDDFLLLQSCERMLNGGLPEDLRPVLVEALFDYRPEKWYSPSFNYSPPDRRLASEQALDQLRKIGRLALSSMMLTVRQKETVRKTLKEIDEMR